MGKADVVSYSPDKRGRAYKLSENITLGEMMSKGTDGSEPTLVDPELIAKIQRMRDLLAASVIINSGYRTVKHNASVGGVANSYHPQGMAADIYFIGVSDEEAAKCAEYVGFGGVGLYPGRIHVDTRTNKYRYKKPANVEIAVSGFPGYVPPAVPIPAAAPEPVPADIVPVRLLCRCGGVLSTVEGLRIKGTVYAPVRAVGEGLGHDVEWDGKQATVR